MDWKSIVLNKRMKFFLNITLISSCLFLNWAYPCDAQDILEPSHQLFCQYSMHHSLLPKNDDPNIVCSAWEIPAAKDEMNDLSASLPKYLYSMKGDIQRACEHGPCSQLLLVSLRFQNYISESENHDNDVGGRPEEHGNDIWSPIQYGNSNCLSNVSSCGRWTFNKTKTFIETKVTAMKLKGFNL